MSTNCINTWQSVMILCCQLHSDSLHPYYNQEWLQTTLSCVSIIFELPDIDYALTNIYTPEPLWITSSKILISVPAYSRLLNMPVSCCKSSKSFKFMHNFNIFDTIQAMEKYDGSRTYRENELVHKPMNNVEKTVIVMLVRVILAVRHLYLHYQASSGHKRGKLSNVKWLDTQHDNFPNIVFAQSSGSFDKPEIIGLNGLYDNRTGNNISQLDYNDDDVYCSNRRMNDRDDGIDQNDDDDKATKRYQCKQQKQRKRLFTTNPPRQPPQHYSDYQYDNSVHLADTGAAAAHNTNGYMQLSLDGIRDTSSSSDGSSNSRKRRKFSLYDNNKARDCGGDDDDDNEDDGDNDKNNDDD